MSENQTQIVKERVVADIKSKYSWLSDVELNRTYDYAIADYLFYKYPTDNNRPNVEEFVVSFMVEQWIKQRMEDILSRAGGINADAYSENGIDIEYGASHIDPFLASKITPKASVPN